MSHNSSLSPLTHIQHDWYLSPNILSSASPLLKSPSLSDPDKSHINKDTFWVLTSEPTELRYEISRDGDNVQIRRKYKLGESSERDKPEEYALEYDKSSRTLNVKDAESGTVTQKFTHEKRIFENLHGMTRKPILSVDVSPQGELGVSASTEGSLRVWSTKTGHAVRDMSLDLEKYQGGIPKGHVGDVYVSRFLPSGEVVMSAGADTRILVWRISDALCAATLSGHNGGVTAVSFIERGRNFVSSSRDGTVRLWDCATQTGIAEVFRAQEGVSSPISVNSCVVQKNSALSLGDIEAKSAKDFGTEHYVGACAVDDGRAIVYDVRHRKTIFSLQHEVSLGACAFMDNTLTVGQRNGKIVSYDVRKLSSNTDGSVTRGKEEARLTTFTGTASPVLRIAQGWKNSANLVWFSCQDGSVRLLDVSQGKIVRSLSGFDYDAVYDIALHENTVYCGGRDGKVREYVIAA